MSRRLIENYNKDYIENLAKKSLNMTELMNKLGYTHNSGSSRITVYKYLTENSIDISHFDNSKTIKKYNSLLDIFKENSTYTNIFRLKEKIIKYDLLEYKCAICGNNGIWNNKKLTLELDHINGDNMNHSLNNLRFLCPNCHSQTSSYSKSK